MVNMLKTILVALAVVSCSVLRTNATFHSKQNEVEPKPDIFGSLLAMKKNLFSGLKSGGGSNTEINGGEENGYSYSPPASPAPKPVYGPPAPKPVYGPPAPKPVYGPPAPKPVYGPPAPKPVYGPPAPKPVYGPPAPKPMYGPPAHKPAAPIGIVESGSSASAQSGLGGHGNIFKSIGDLPAKAIGAKRDAINKILDKKLALIQQLSGGLGGKSHAEASSSNLDF